jgi:hypothetical protein
MQVGNGAERPEAIAVDLPIERRRRRGVVRDPVGVEPRPLTEREHEILAFLLSAEFPDVEKLRRQRKLPRSPADANVAAPRSTCAWTSPCLQPTKLDNRTPWMQPVPIMGRRPG